MLCLRPARERRTTRDCRPDFRADAWPPAAAMVIFCAERLGEGEHWSNFSAERRSTEGTFTTTSDTSICTGDEELLDSSTLCSCSFETFSGDCGAADSSSTFSACSFALAAALVRVLRFTGSLSAAVAAAALLRRVRRTGSSATLSVLLLGTCASTNSEIELRVSWTEERRRLLRFPLEKLKREQTKEGKDCYSWHTIYLKISMDAYFIYLYIIL